VLEVFDGGSGVFYRLTVVPSEHLESWGQALSKVTSELHYRMSGRTQRLEQRPGRF
jgi:hypothetical protein